MAVYSIVEQWMKLRTYMQEIWRQVAYGGLNSAVAGAMSNITIAIVKQAESAIFVEFPGHESYETVMNTITRGNPDKAQGMFQINLYRMSDAIEATEKVRTTYVDVKEEFMIHAYWDLIDFVLDFQKTRSGKPTKPMLSKIRDWDQKFDLQRATNVSDQILGVNSLFFFNPPAVFHFFPPLSSSA